ncbi:peptidoglycan glycosyltransferase FtsI [Alginatibacterium sediminis]|uniref:Peptidoglycan D,D-transpeptidase FtsI n=1 Tax=Alginatibacterium sediminis TaxID=2164068 RepID=A0A420E8X1_9ALTE|nr:penicillin-binding transpeptidase domain-containing protein [Alginatibacterium sediminis]RKF15890.1 peptidoglycan glycosyltransferase FtsI [Alginatibacterium sediminis]
MNKRSKKPQLLISWRFTLVAVVVFSVFMALVVRTAYIQVWAPERLVHEGDLRSVRTMSNFVERGVITDRNGRELAVSVPVRAIYADPKRVHEQNGLDKLEAWHALADVLETDSEKLLNKVKDPKRRFVYLKRQVSPAIAGYIEKLKIPGVYLKAESRRFYPTGEVSAHLVGFTNIDGAGQEGVEQSYNHWLSAEAGKRQVRKDRAGRVIEDLDVLSKSKDSNDIVLSIDQRLQAIAYKELKKAVADNQATAGSVVVIDIQTGEVLAMANSPSFNPNDRKQFKGFLFRNRAITDAFEPGSVFKPFTVLTALEKGVVDDETMLNTSPGYMNIGGRRVRDSRNYGTIDLTTVIQKSSNVATSQLALKVGVNSMIDTFYRLGFGNDAGLGLVGESAGQVPQRSRWSDFELATLSFGYGVMATPLQIAHAYATVGSAGFAKPISILKVDKAEKGKQVFNSQNTKALLEMMESVTLEGGTGRKAAVEGYRIAGKTGTSRKAIRGGYGDDYVAIFAGVAPLTNPRLAIVVTVDEPQGDTYYGGSVSGPVFSKVMEAGLHFLNVAPDADVKQWVQLEELADARS